MTNLYAYFIPDAKNYKRQLDVQLDRLVPGSMTIDGMTIDYRDEFDNPPEFISRLIMMCDDIEQVSDPVDQAKKARLLGRALPVIDAGREKHGYPNTIFSAIIQKEPSLATMSRNQKSDVTP